MTSAAAATHSERQLAIIADLRSEAGQPAPWVDVYRKLAGVIRQIIAVNVTPLKRSA